MTVKNNTNTTHTFRNPTTDETTAMHNEHSTKPKELENLKTEIAFGNDKTTATHNACSTKPKELENPKTEIAFGNSQQIHNNMDFTVKTCKKLYHK